MALERWIEILETRNTVPSEQGYVITRTQLCSVLAMSQKTIVKLKSEKVLKQMRHKYSLEQALDAFKEQLHGVASRATKEQNPVVPPILRPAYKTVDRLPTKAFIPIQCETLRELNAKARAKTILNLESEIRIGLREAQLVNNTTIEEKIKELGEKLKPLLAEI